MMADRREVGAGIRIRARGDPLACVSRRRPAVRTAASAARRLLHEREGADERRLHPVGREDEEPQGRPARRRARIEVDDQGRATGVLYLKNGREYFQPAKVVVMPPTRTGTRGPASSRPRRPFPNGLSNNHGQVGKHYIAHGSVGRATGWFPGKRSTATAGRWGSSRRSTARRGQLRPHRPRLHRRRDVQRHDGGEADRRGERDAAERRRWGSSWKAWLAQNADSVAGVGRSSRCCPTRTTTSTSTRRSRPARPAGDPDHERLPRQRAAASDYVQEKMVEWLKAAGAAEVWTARRVRARSARTRTAERGWATTRTSTSSTAGGCPHEVPNLAIMGGSTFPSSAGRNPTQTIQATAWRTAEHIVQNFKTIAD